MTKIEKLKIELERAKKKSSEWQARVRDIEKQMEESYGRGNRPRGYGKGNYKASGNLAFAYQYTVDDTDGDTLTVKEELNDTELRTINNAPKGEALSISLTAEQLYNLQAHQLGPEYLRAGHRPRPQDRELRRAVRRHRRRGRQRRRHRVHRR